MTCIWAPPTQTQPPILGFPVTHKPLLSDPSDAQPGTTHSVSVSYKTQVGAGWVMKSVLLCMYQRQDVSLSDPLCTPEILQRTWKPKADRGLTRTTFPQLLSSMCQWFSVDWILKGQSAVKTITNWGISRRLPHFKWLITKQMSPIQSSGIVTSTLMLSLHMHVKIKA